MATTAIRLAGSASSRMLLPVAKEQQTRQRIVEKGIYCFKQFFINPENRLAKFVGTTKSLDKCFKLSKAVSDCAVGVLEETGSAGDALTSAKSAQSILKTTREVVALGNVLNGVVPVIFNSSQKCYQYARQAWHLGGKGIAEKEAPKKYNEMLLNRGDYLWATSQEACSVVSATTYSTTFGVLRPLMLINKLTAKPFLDKTTSSHFGTAVAGVMTINHIAGVVGAGCGLVLEQRMYKRAQESLHLNQNSKLKIDEEVLNSETLLSAERALRKEHTASVKKAILTMIEKGLELVVDAIKLIPLPITVACGAAISGALTAVSSAVGLYGLWQKTKSKG
ncbi:hypothetical protein [Candidatus Chlamydia corallus]|uniref:CT529 family inclusion membrane protein n=1 Tax=Candidatus Chlamydia corallus TaxID=2038470 RepID=UPI000C2FC935|nr:hypothetical protein [Candidatus Chlamydia corallus]